MEFKENRQKYDCLEDHFCPFKVEAESASIEGVLVEDLPRNFVKDISDYEHICFM